MLHRRIHFFRLITLGVLIMAGCKKDTTPPGEDASSLSLQQYVAAEKNTSIFNAALQRSGLQQDSAYLSGGPYTFFVPVDSAFIAQGMSLAVINAMNKDSLLAMLKYMVVKGRISSSTLAGFFRQSALTLSDKRPILTKNYYGIFFNGIAMKEPNINLGDAVVHKMNRCAFAPKDSVLALIANTPELSIFYAVINRCLDVRFPNYFGTVHYLFRTNGKTVFAPDNDAFIRYGIPSVDYVETMTDIETLAVIVRSHAYIGSYLVVDPTAIDNSTYSRTVSDFTGGFVLNGMGGSDYLTSPSVREDGLTIKTLANYPDVQISKTDLLAVDGIVQEVNQVLLLK